MELRNNDLPFDPNRLQDKARLAREEMKKAVEDARTSHADRQGEIRAAKQRIAEAREAHAEAMQDLREQGEARRQENQDSIELSDAARKFASGKSGEASEEARAELVESFKIAYKNGDLNTRERMERAAENLLSEE